MTMLTRWEPFRELTDMRRNMDRMMDRFFDDRFFDDRFLAATPGWTGREGDAWSLPLDVAEDDNQYIIRASVPGIDPEDIEVTLTDNVLTIKGETKSETESKETNWHLRERRYGSFMRSVTLPAPVDAAKVEATNEHGVLTLHLPKAEAIKPKKIAVKAAVNGK